MKNSNDTRLRIAALFSGGASSVMHLATFDKNFGKNYEIVGLITDNKNASGIKFIEDKIGLATYVFDIKDFYKRHGHDSIKDQNLRIKYFDEILPILKFMEPDLILLSGFMLKISTPFLNEFKNRIINVHPADLRILDEDSKPKYRGLNVVKKAIDEGEKLLYSTIHFVDEEVDCGRIICVSPEPVTVEPDKSPDYHQELMKFSCDGHAYQKALQMICSGEVVIG
jgi:phosphoribosylglycinamide formyltransferase 1